MTFIQTTHNQKGVTLIELLVSIVILGIVLTGMLGYFTQMIKYSSLTDDKITSINLGEIVLNEFELTEHIKSEHIEQHVVNGKTYFAKVIKLNKQNDLKLIPIKVEIYTDSSLESSYLATELFGYKELD